MPADLRPEHAPAVQQCLLVELAGDLSRPFLGTHSYGTTTGVFSRREIYSTPLHPIDGGSFDIPSGASNIGTFRTSAD